MTHAALLRLPSTLRAPALVRAGLREACDELPQALLQDALLLATEVVTNAVVHAPQAETVTVTIECDRAMVCVTVSDEGDGQLDPRADDLDAEGGRGLGLMQEIASGWGVRPATTGPGKTVWFLVGHRAGP